MRNLAIDIGHLMLLPGQKFRAKKCGLRVDPPSCNLHRRGRDLVAHYMGSVHEGESGLLLLTLGVDDSWFSGSGLNLIKLSSMSILAPP